MTDSPETTDSCPPENPEKSLREWDAFFAKWGRVNDGVENPPPSEQKLTQGALTQEDF